MDTLLNFISNSFILISAPGRMLFLCLGWGFKVIQNRDRRSQIETVIGRQLQNDALAKFKVTVRFTNVQDVPPVHPQLAVATCRRGNSKILEGKCYDRVITGYYFEELQ